MNDVFRLLVLSQDHWGVREIRAMSAEIDTTEGCHGSGVRRYWPGSHGLEGSEGDPSTLLPRLLTPRTEAAATLPRL